MLPDFFTIFKEKGYEVLESDHVKPYRLNIVGLRNKCARVDQYDDQIVVFWGSEQYRWSFRVYPATTLPGTPWLFNPMNAKGTAVLVPGHYRSCFALGKFRNYEVLRQVGPVSVYRDSNRNGVVDYSPDKVDTGIFGIHIHRAGMWSKLVGESSAGCQVLQREVDFTDLIDLCKLHAMYWGNSFTYSLLEV